MYKIAFVPPNEAHFDKNFDWDKELVPWVNPAKRYLREEGIEFNIITEVNDLREVDLFIFENTYSYHYEWYMKVLKMGLINRCVYYMVEPAAVMYWHIKENVPNIKKYFHFVVSDKKDIYSIDNTRLYDPILWDMSIKPSSIPFDNKKLLCNISGNKSSDYPGELYSTRLRIIEWFENNHPEEFDLFGFDWSGHICNRGKCQNKCETYHEYKFSLCLENSTSTEENSYVSEKIFQCIESQIVPIYKGAENISEIVPKECYISLDDYSSIEELYEYLVNMQEDTYMQYILAAQKYVSTEGGAPRDFATFRDDIINIIEKIREDNKWQMRKKDKFTIYRKYLWYRITDNRVLQSVYRKNSTIRIIWRFIKRHFGRKR